ncbi:hypothetical protein [Nocardia veterana]|uniref:Uncharacterized protein n=1 Tax=Nocardia veterana TaxID=132249 RepID=A0A7X6M182_9NOCA|nr:hypothetical protein [Nocardia veterana]NKY88322.1 hypothetical protein [Nocardia veterana]
MPLTTGRYGDTSHRNPLGWLAHRAALAVRSLRRDPRDNGGGYTMHREYGAWVLRPVSGWRSLRWITPPTAATRSVTDRDAALDWYAAKLGV